MGLSDTNAMHTRVHIIFTFRRQYILPGARLAIKASAQYYFCMVCIRVRSAACAEWGQIGCYSCVCSQPLGAFFRAQKRRIFRLSISVTFDQLYRWRGESHSLGSNVAALNKAFSSTILKGAHHYCTQWWTMSTKVINWMIFFVAVAADGFSPSLIA